MGDAAIGSVQLSMGDLVGRLERAITEAVREVEAKAAETESSLRRCVEATDNLRRIALENLKAIQSEANEIGQVVGWRPTDETLLDAVSRAVTGKVSEAVRKEREGCAKEAEGEASTWRATGGYHTAIRISKRIRARKP